MKPKSTIAASRCVVALFLLSLPLALTGFAPQETVYVGAGKGMRAHIILPDGKGPFPGILVLHTSGGLQQPDLDYAKELAKEGYVCLVPAFMEAYGITSRNRQLTFTLHADGIFADLVDAVELLRKRPEIDKERLGAVGFSNGGYWALLLAARGKIWAGVSYYGALSGGGTDRQLTSFQGAFTKESSPVLILHGSRDSVVPVDVAQRLVSLLEEKKAPYEAKIYQGAEHGYDRGFRTFDVKADADARDDSWNRTLDSFRKHLRKP